VYRANNDDDLLEAEGILIEGNIVYQTTIVPYYYLNSMEKDQGK
jgi:hypothetical protein